MIKCIFIHNTNKDNIQFNIDNTFKTYLTKKNGIWQYNDNVLKIMFDNNVYELYYNYNNSFKNIQFGIYIIFNNSNLYNFFNKNYGNMTINGDKPGGYFISRFIKF